MLPVKVCSIILHLLPNLIIYTCQNLILPAFTTKILPSAQGLVSLFNERKKISKTGIFHHREIVISLRANRYNTRTIITEIHVNEKAIGQACAEKMDSNKKPITVKVLWKSSYFGLRTKKNLAKTMLLQNLTTKTLFIKCILILLKTLKNWGMSAN